MKKYFIVACMTVSALVPTMANAQSSCERQRSNRVIGTVAGAGVGAVLGNVIAGRGNRTLGTVLGGVAGGVAGNQIAKPSNDCARAYGYYDDSGKWHATGVDRRYAEGYYDRNGDWVAGAPDGAYDDNGRYVPASSEGYYDQNDRWLTNARYSTNGSSNARRDDAYGYYDSKGMWHATSVNRARASGYYDRNNNWVAGQPNGYYDRDGRWVQSSSSSGSTNGYYDGRGRWIPVASRGYYDNDGNWIAGAAPGYYNSRGRWVAGSTVGYYDRNGRWTRGVNRNDDGSGRYMQPGYYDRNGRWVRGDISGYYDGRGTWVSTGGGVNSGGYGSAPREFGARTQWLEDYIRGETSRGSLGRNASDRAMRDLENIRRTERSLGRNRNGNLSVRDEAALNIRLDRLSDRIGVPN